MQNSPLKVLTASYPLDADENTARSTEPATNDESSTITPGDREFSINEEILEKEANILIVDDLPDNLRALSAILSIRGYKVRKAIGGQQALETVRSHPPSLILLDIKMPGIDGYEVCSHLKADPNSRHIPVIFLSALSETDDKVQAFSVGGSDYITKPFHAEEVMARVENQLRIQRLTQELAQQNAALQQSEARERQKAQELKVTLEELKHTQVQLIQAAKMSSLGQMVAGIAHEINNPLTFIHGNLNFAREYFRDLLNLINLYREHYPKPQPAIQQFTDAIDLEYLIKDWHKLLDSMQTGAKRIQEIVQSLKDFSRLDEAQVKSIDINQAIEKTLFVLEHRLKAAHVHPIRVLKDYDHLPKITCYANQLNQVFMHLLNNAIDAVETKPEPRIIQIRTCMKPTTRRPKASLAHKASENHQDQTPSSQSIFIKITDNGSGITEEIQNHIFDPFFTTKPVGSGTGMGLSISHQIVVENHRGQLCCISIPGKGTTFIVEIPITC